VKPGETYVVPTDNRFLRICNSTPTGLDSTPIKCRAENGTWLNDGETAVDLEKNFVHQCQLNEKGATFDPIFCVDPNGKYVKDGSLFIDSSAEFVFKCWFDVKERLFWRTAIACVAKNGTWVSNNETMVVGRFKKICIVINGDAIKPTVACRAQNGTWVNDGDTMLSNDGQSMEKCTIQSQLNLNNTYLTKHHAVIETIACKMSDGSWIYANDSRNTGKGFIMFSNLYRIVQNIL